MCSCVCVSKQISTLSSTTRLSKGKTHLFISLDVQFALFYSTEDRNNIVLAQYILIFSVYICTYKGNLAMHT